VAGFDSTADKFAGSRIWL
jgi:bifunctional non-homologous end joining protein LigD